MKYLLLLLLSILTFSCSGPKGSESENDDVTTNTISLYSAENPSTLTFNTETFLDGPHTISFVEYESGDSCTTDSCIIDEFETLIEFPEYVISYDSTRFHAIMVDGVIVKCLFD